MHKDTEARLTEVVKSLDSNIEVTAACGRRVATKLLQMARLDLLSEIHEISDTELRVFAKELGRKQRDRKNVVIYFAERKRLFQSRG